ncbi:MULTISPECIES: hypothetical protein [unclassified Streptomyces]|uniref:hypothetical protein n=1 Tax=unclassified Streptomyces TaxID=2593676 RepID=UPI00057E705E|nr:MULTISPECIES: hypothetical protein [unclassified Streptomyces]AJC59507.1 hypothetical protein GZL_06948 [Streptomyces sp. 769]QZL08741.1 hypothetical protein K2224_37485 [Streptomyces sp. BHT-5-2]
MFDVKTLARLLRAHLAEVRRHARSDAGYTTETVLITALLVILALSVVGIIVAKVTAKAKAIDLG